MQSQKYAMFILRGKTYNKMTKEVVTQHVENLKALDEEGKLAYCGVFKGYPGVAGMVILNADSREEAEALCKREPLVVLGYASYKLYDFRQANRENNFLL